MGNLVSIGGIFTMFDRKCVGDQSTVQRYKGQARKGVNPNYVNPVISFLSTIPHAREWDSYGTEEKPLSLPGPVIAVKNHQNERSVTWAQSPHRPPKKRDGKPKPTARITHAGGK